MQMGLTLLQGAAMSGFYGFLAGHSCFFDAFFVFGLLAFLGFRGIKLLPASIAFFILVIALGWSKLLLAVLGAVLLALNLPPFRQFLVSKHIMRLIEAAKLIPQISETEKTALEAGTVWLDAEIFSGRPDFKKILAEPYCKLSEKEQRFLGKEVEELCALINDYELHERGDLTPELWDKLKKDKFWGLIIPEGYGGLGFSNLAHAEILTKIVTVSVPVAITVMVPNSLGPAELLVHYGTDEQKKFYLPRLANGEEIPAFGLTELEAGSDAGSIRSNGVVFKGEDGKIYIRLNWSKRYITLGSVATLIGLAIKLKDPDNILGKGTDLGITCVLVPSASAGVDISRRHNPLGIPFINSPISGRDVVVSIDQVIGGVAGVGQGWRMLMESLSAGRSISLPSQSSGSIQKGLRVVSAYAEVRKQFGMSIGRFDGVGEVLSRIGAYSYLCDAARIFTVSAVDQGSKPSVISAIIKYNTTEISRMVGNDVMDIMGGAGISKGPKNLVLNHFLSGSIGITVEGANILTRTMIIFGQGAVRCHPYAFQEMQALAAKDLVKFDKALFGHMGHFINNFCRAFFLSLTRGRLAKVPDSPMTPYYRKVAWASASFGFLADLAMMVLGGSLKFQEKISGRFADILSWIYLSIAVLRRFEAEGRQKAHEPFACYALDLAMARIQHAFDGLYANLSFPIGGWLFRCVIATWSRLNSLDRPLSDAMGQKIVQTLLSPGSVRDELTASNMYFPKDANNPFFALEQAYSLTCQAEGVTKKILNAMRSKKIPKGKPGDKLAEAQQAGVITAEEANLLGQAEKARLEVLAVDSFLATDFG